MREKEPSHFSADFRVEGSTPSFETQRSKNSQKLLKKVTLKDFQGRKG